MLLPLFPLEVVLLPGTVLPLHIFEERYKLMVGEAIQHNSEFGIVRIKENSLLNVGCAAKVEKVVKRYPDGRFDIITVGQRRFEVLFIDEQKPYLQAGVMFFDDDPNSEAEPEALRELEELFERASKLVAGQLEEQPPRAASASFRIAGSLPLDLDVKQQVLALRSERERVETLCEYLQKAIPRMELSKRVDRVSRGNGRGR